MRVFDGNVFLGAKLMRILAKVFLDENLWKVLDGINVGDFMGRGSFRIVFLCIY